ncbi:hemagglutinin repeat-containing protein [Thorsellia anophelis]|uniref:hemagglutinin repeat-containing protein n=1 Tax=Thorsellia anophelis TaxID=336804 RepID=UPI000B886BDC
MRIFSIKLAAVDAKRDILLQVAKDTSNLDDKNGSKGGSLGLTNIASELNAGNLITLNSGRDTQIIGTQVKGDGVTLNVGNDLRIESLQHTDNYYSKQTDFSENVSVGTGSMSISHSKTKIDSDYANV